MCAVTAVGVKHRESTVLEGLDRGIESELRRCESRKKTGKAGEVVCDRCDIDG